MGKWQYWFSLLHSHLRESHSAPNLTSSIGLLSTSHLTLSECGEAGDMLMVCQHRGRVRRTSGLPVCWLGIILLDLRCLVLVKIVMLSKEIRVFLYSAISIKTCSSRVEVLYTTQRSCWIFLSIRLHCFVCSFYKTLLPSPLRSTSSNCTNMEFVLYSLQFFLLTLRKVSARCPLSLCI